MRFYLGTHRPDWLARAGVRLFVARQAFGRCRTKLPRAVAPWALDSGGFTELGKHGCWTVSPAEYVAEVRRLRDEVGSLEWAAPQDWMCEPHVVRKTGLDVEEHVRRTVDNFLELRSLAPDLPFVPVLQGWTGWHYAECAELYDRAGVDLAAEPVVGLGSICRRQDAVRSLHLVLGSLPDGLRLPGFGLKKTGLLGLAGEEFHSADSLAWSVHERLNKTGLQNDLDTALWWREMLLNGLERIGRSVDDT